MKYWKTREGKIIKIKDMDDNHLLKTIDYIKRNKVTVFYSYEEMCKAAGFLRGEMAQDTIIDNSVDSYGEEQREEYHFSLEYMIKEAKKRNLIV